MAEDSLMSVEVGAQVIICMRSGWELRGQVRAIGSFGLCILDPLLNDKIGIPQDEVVQIRELENVR